MNIEESKQHNKSIQKYLEENTDLLKEYFTECYAELKDPNYSEFCYKYLGDGTTSDGIRFNSILVRRSELTEFLRVGYRVWLIS